MLLALVFACASSETPAPAPNAEPAATPAGEVAATPAPPAEGATPASPPPADAPPGGAPAPGADGSAAQAQPLPADQQGAIRVVGPDASKAITEPIGKLLEASGLKVSEVAADGAGASLSALKEGKADVAIIARALKPAESEFIATPIAYDAVVLVISPDNKVDNLTKAQAAGLLSGKVTNWKDVGGADVPVHLFVRGEGKTATKIVEDYLGLSGKFPASAKLVEKEKEVLSALKADAGGLGFVSLAGLNNKDNTSGAKRLSLDGVAPDAASVTSQKYPLLRPLNAITVGAPTGPAKGFIDFCRSGGGQKVISETYAAVM